MRVVEQPSGGGRNNYVGTITLTPAVEPENVTYDFRSGGATGAERGTKAHTITIEGGANWEVIQELTATRLRSTANSALYMESYGFYAGFGVADEPVESDIALKIVVPEDGYYTANLFGFGYNAGAVSALYVDDIYLGQYDYYSQAEVTAKPAKNLRTVWLAKGDHTLIMRCIAAAQGAKWACTREY